MLGGPPRRLLEEPIRTIPPSFETPHSIGSRTGPSQQEDAAEGRNSPQDEQAQVRSVANETNRTVKSQGVTAEIHHQSPNAAGHRTIALVEVRHRTHHPSRLKM